MDLKKIETTTTLRTLPSGHVAHKLTEFAPGGLESPNTGTDGAVSSENGRFHLKNRSDRVHSFAGTPGPSRKPVGPQWMCATRNARDVVPP